jgi:hypothetical protein
MEVKRDLVLTHERENCVHSEPFERVFTCLRFAASCVCVSRSDMYMYIYVCICTMCVCVCVRT